MSEYIDRDKAIDLFYSVDPENDGSDECTIVLESQNYTSSEIEYLLSCLPAADVAPVVHGRWKYTSSSCSMFTGVYKCSCCGVEDENGECYNFCPNCGAKMDLEEEQ